MRIYGKLIKAASVALYLTGEKNKSNDLFFFLCVLLEEDDMGIQ